MEPRRRVIREPQVNNCKLEKHLYVLFVINRPVHGLIFLYKWRAEEQPQGSVVRDSRLNDIFFAKQARPPTHMFHYSLIPPLPPPPPPPPLPPLQVIKNACATLAILNLLLNTTHSDISLGSTLSEFKEFTIPLDPAVSLTALAFVRCD